MWPILWCALQDGNAELPAIVVERKVHLRLVDTTNRETEIGRKERLTLVSDRVRIEDLTFGTTLIVRLDQNKVLLLDRTLRQYSEFSSERVAEARREFLATLSSIKDRVRGTVDQQDLEKTERGFQSYAVSTADESPTGRKETILGAEREERRLLVNGNIEIYRGFFDDSIPEAAVYFKALCAISCFGEGVAPRIGAIQGFPLRGTFRYALFRNRVVAEEEVSSIRRDKVAGSAFEPPQGWKQIQFREVEPESEKEIPIPDSLKR
jgi:hypothetical protein